MNTFALVIAILPLAAYSLVLGMLYTAKRPSVISGSRDVAILGIAMSGLAFIGPIQLFFPTAIFNIVGHSVWIVLAMLYFFVIAYATLNVKPRIVVYGIRADELSSSLNEALTKNGLEQHWMGQNCSIPQLGIDGVVEDAGHGFVSHVASTRIRQEPIAWAKLRQIIANEMRTKKVRSRAAGVMWFSFGLFLSMVVWYEVYFYSPDLAAGMREMLRI